MMNRKNAGNQWTPRRSSPRRALAIAVALSLAAVPGAAAVEPTDLASLVASRPSCRRGRMPIGLIRRYRTNRRHGSFHAAWNGSTGSTGR